MEMKGTSDAASREPEKVIHEKLYRNFWRFHYVHRHFSALVEKDGVLKSNVEKSLRALPALYAELAVEGQRLERDDPYYMTKLFEFTNCLVYEFHKRDYADGFEDPYYEELVNLHQNPFRKLKFVDDREMVQFFHSWTVEFGFLIVPLFFKPDTTCCEAFINNSSEDVIGHSLPLIYTYPKFEETLKGVKISTNSNRFQRPEGFDLAVYWQREYGNKGKEIELSKQLKVIKDQLKNCWKRGGVQEVGEKEGYEVALYVQRKKCSKNHVLERLEGQVKWTKQYPSRYWAWFPDPIVADEATTKRLTKDKESLMRSIQLSEDLTKKKLSLASDNFRRAVGLYLWDSLNIEGVDKTRHAFILDTLDYLHNNHVNKLTHYYKNYNTLYNKPTKPAAPKEEPDDKLSDKQIKEKNEKEKTTYSGPIVYKERLMGDEEQAKIDVKRDMEDDYQLTEFCIEQAEYCSLEDRKKARKTTDESRPALSNEIVRGPMVGYIPGGSKPKK
jgi:hypothetical protein